MIRKVASVAIASAVLIGGIAFAQDITLTPTYGEVALVTGFQPDPRTVQVVSGGPIDAAAANLGTGCTGFIASAPDFRVRFTPGALPLIISVLSETDTTLVINDPNGNWVCNDDANGTNPVVTFATPTAGQYDIWVGTFGGATTAPATLNISEVR